jgi:hypothetical protein
MNQPISYTWWRTWFDMERFATVLLFVVLASVACLMPAQSDTWWQLRTGEDIWRSRHIVLHDELTHTVAGRYWPNHEWLTQVVFYGCYRLGGLPLLTAVCAAAVLATWLLVLRLTPGPALLRLLLVFCGAAFSTATWSLRPQVLTFALFAATLWVLARRRFLWILPPLFLIWANLHGGVAAGGVLIVAAVLGSAILAPRHSVRLIAIGVACLAATAATPLGFSLWLEIPASLGRLKIYGVTEWLAPGVANPLEGPFWMMAIGLCIVAVVRRKALRSLEAATLTLAAILVLGLALRSARNIPLFFICAIPAFATLLHEPTVRASEQKTRHPAPGLAAAVLALCICAALAFVAYAWRTPLPGLRWKPLGDETIAAIAACEGPLYNRYDEGGYLEWFLKDRKVFMDSRQDPFPPELVLDQIRLEKTGDYVSTFRQYAIRCALTPDGSPLSLRLEQDGWRRQAGARPWIVYSRPPMGLRPADFGTPHSH